MDLLPPESDQALRGGSTAAVPQPTDQTGQPNLAVIHFNLPEEGMKKGRDSSKLKNVTLLMLKLMRHPQNQDVEISKIRCKA